MSVTRAPRSTRTSPYEMTINLNVLNHLGIGLYSNVPAVISEVVANAWDADADEVRIDIDKVNGEIVVKDDGVGMTKKDINDRYLNVGYRKRDEVPGKTKKGREPMGRKGIGKLSVFSIAKTVEVYSTKNSERHAFRMNSDDIQKKIKSREKTGVYRPDRLDPDLVDFDKGTKIFLRDLTKRLTGTEKFLRRRLARRFSIIGAKHDFEVIIDGEPISAKDRGYYDKVEFLWHVGDLAELDDGYFRDPGGRRELRENIRNHFPVDGVVDAEKGWIVKGWIGTVDEQKNIDEEYNTIVVFARGKLVHEDVLKDLKEGGIYSKYLIGEIEADFMDTNTEDDIVTSDRQSVKQDDERYEKLRDYVRTILKRIQNQWTNLRKEVGTERATEHPAIKEWYERLKGDKKKYARTMFGKIESLHIPDPEAKKELYKSSLLAFERLALKDSLSDLERIESEQDFAMLTSLFNTIDDIEAVLYHGIAKGRLEIVKKFEVDLPEAKERIIQEHIYDHLWLLDPSWERAAGSERIEQAVTKEFGKHAKLTRDEERGRIDIRYKTTAGKHVIVELKKYDRDITIEELVKQVRKYRSALEKCLEAQFPGERSKDIEIVCVLGKTPVPRDEPERNRQVLAQYGARYVTYDDLVTNSQRSYGEYLERQREISDLVGIIERLDETFVTESATNGSPADDLAEVTS